MSVVHEIGGTLFRVAIESGAVSYFEAQNEEELIEHMFADKRFIGKHLTCHRLLKDGSMLGFEIRKNPLYKRLIGSLSNPKNLGDAMPNLRLIELILISKEAKEVCPKYMLESALSELRLVDMALNRENAIRSQDEKLGRYVRLLYESQGDPNSKYLQKLIEWAETEKGEK